MNGNEKLFIEKVVGKQKITLVYDTWSLHRIFRLLGNEMNMPSSAIQHLWEQFQKYSESQDFILINSSLLTPVLHSKNEKIIGYYSRKYIVLSTLKLLKSSYFNNLTPYQRVYKLYKPILQCLVFFLVVNYSISNVTFNSKEIDTILNNHLIQILVVFALKFITDSIYIEQSILKVIKLETDIIKIEVTDLPLE